MTPETETPPPTEDLPRAAPPTASPERVKRLYELAAKSTATWDNMLGVGKDWWTDEEFEEFLAFLRRSRRGEPL
jgi:hypothetical protein